jgi:hypothetical protein
MWHSLKLLIPALVPSWRFFDIIAPSPRIQFTLLKTEDEPPAEWYEFRPRPAHLSFPQMLGRMLWNPKWNETMFVVSCAERLMDSPTRHSEDEIMKRIIDDVVGETSINSWQGETYVQFRLLIVERQGVELQEEVTYYSRIERLPTRKVT